MQFIVLALAASAGLVSAQSASASSTTTPAATGPQGAPSSTISAAAGSLALGAECNPNVKPSQCGGGAECWASNFMLIARCGNFNAACTKDSECAYNTCNNGICNGLKPSSTISASSTPSGAMPAPSSTISAAAGSLAIGAECNPFVKPSQCSGDVQCWASNAMLIARCGNFNAACTKDTQCAYNTCNNGLCNGLLVTTNGTMTTSTTIKSNSSTTADAVSMKPTTITTKIETTDAAGKVTTLTSALTTSVAVKTTGPVLSASQTVTPFTGAGTTIAIKTASGVLAVFFAAVVMVL